jgi:hypothetical protein
MKGAANSECLKVKSVQLLSQDTFFIPENCAHTSKVTFKVTRKVANVRDGHIPVLLIFLNINPRISQAYL